MTSKPFPIIRRPRASDLFAIVLVSAMAACDAAPPDDAPSEPSAKSGAYESAPEQDDQAPTTEPSAACPIPDGPWRRGAVLGPDELREFMVAFESGCPQTARPTPSAAHLDFVVLEPEDTISPDTFCTTDWPEHVISRETLPARTEEAAVIPARFEVDTDLMNRADLTARLESIRPADLVAPSDALRLVGLDGSWRDDSAETPTP